MEVLTLGADLPTVPVPPFVALAGVVAVADRRGFRFARLDEVSAPLSTALVEFRVPVRLQRAQDKWMWSVGG